MRYGLCGAFVGVLALGAGSAAAAAGESDPFRLALVDEPESVYPQIAPPRPEDGFNAGAVHFNFDVGYWTRYVYRGVDQSTRTDKRENSLQFNGIAEFDLGKLPHPFVGLFVNVFNNDPVTRFEEVRPYAGLIWTLRPLTITGAYTSYIFPDRKSQDTQEVWASVQLDDSRVWHTEKPVFSPYVMGAYDFDLYNGFYLEAGVKHDFVFEDIGVTATPSAAVAYVINNPYFRQAPLLKDTGLQHWEVGLTLTYSLNSVLNVPRRYGEWRLKGYLFYDNGIESHLRAANQLYGGGGISFEY